MPNAGKTTFINSLCESIPDSERVVTIEDARELSLKVPFWSAYQTKERATADDRIMIGQEQLLEQALRMRPDRIIVGEVRNPKATYVMLQAANTGHEGTMTTVHANSVYDALNGRMTSLVMQGGTNLTTEFTRKEIEKTFHVVIQCVRDRYGLRYVSQIAVLDEGKRDSAGGLDPVIIFSADASPEGPVFKRVGSVPRGGDLEKKLFAANLDPTFFLQSED